MDELLRRFGYFNDLYIRLYDEKNVQKTLVEIFILFMISIPISLLLYLLFNRYRQKMLIDLGQHKWLIKN